MANYLNKEGLTIVLKNLKNYIAAENTSYFNKISPSLTWTNGTATDGPTGTLTIATGKTASIPAIPKASTTAYGVVIVDSAVTDGSANPVSGDAVYTATYTETTNTYEIIWKNED